MDYYDILGVDKSASDKDIKSAFRKKAAELHPDRNKDPKAPEEFKKVNEAYQILSDPQKRKMYDQYGSAPFANGGQGAGGYGGFGGEGMQFDFSDFFGGGFGDIFGDDNPFADVFGGGRRGQPKNQGSDVMVRVRVTMDDVIKGPEKEITYKRKEKCHTCNGAGGQKVETCPNCKGSGKVSQVTRSILGNVQVVRECPECNGSGKKILEKCQTCNGDSVIDAEKKLKIRIPSGIESGMNLRFQNEGNAGRFGSASGDLYVEIDVQNDKKFLRDGDDLLKEVKLPIYSLILGDEIELETYDGNKKVKIPAGLQIGEKLALRNLGVPNIRTKNRGDIILTISVEVPKKLGKEEKELFEQLKGIDVKKGNKFWKF